MARFEAFWDEICSYKDYLWLGVMLMFFFFFLAVISLLFVPWGSPSFWIAVFDFGMVIVGGGTMIWMFWVCEQRAQRYYEPRERERERQRRREQQQEQE